MLRVFKRIWRATWIPEIIAMALSLGAMAAIVAVLGAYNGQNIDSWSFPDNVTINAVIATLNTISRTLLIFALGSAIGQWRWISISRKPRPLTRFLAIDKANQGPLGSVQFLLHTWGRSPVAIGAVIIILNLASDPFIQQIITFQSSPIVTSDPSTTVSRASNYSLNGDTTSPDFIMVEAVFAGLSNRNTTNTAAPYACQSGNCIYPAFQSLGVCSICSNETAQLKQTSTSWDGSTCDALTLGQRHMLWNGDCYNTVNLMNLTVSTPVSQMIWASNEMFEGSVEISSISPSFPERAQHFGAFDPTLSPDFVGSGPSNLSLANWAIINITDFSSAAQWPNSVVSAFECSLYLCVQNISSAVVNGSYTELMSPVNATFLSNPAQDYLLQSDVLSKEIFNVTHNTTAVLQEYFQYLLWVGADDLDTELTIYNDQKTPAFVMPTVSWQGVEYIPTSIVESIYKSPNLSETFANIAQSMSFNIRHYGSGQAVTGQFESRITTVQVHWPWITLPAGNVVVGSIFLVITILASRRSGKPLWKNNLLPVMLHGLDISPSESGTASLLHHEAMAEHARSTSVQLRDTSDKGMAMEIQAEHKHPPEHSLHSEDSKGTPPISPIPNQTLGVTGRLGYARVPSANMDD